MDRRRWRYRLFVDFFISFVWLVRFRSFVCFERDYVVVRGFEGVV